ncbi:transcriptional regulator [Candidatus Lokiarchaeum ossiferum]|uniref:transcriptional regulator n=1 Tax=Candidatus Lokiarchaeum ossiferum TaxID=2951803 RepID=UPI00352C8C4C
MSKLLEDTDGKIEDSLDITENKLEIIQNPIFSSTTRLTILMILNANHQVGFTNLRKLLKITAGNLDHHTKTLETAGFLKKFKTFSFKKPMTVLKITDCGKKAFRTYVDQLTEFINRSIEK